MCVSIITVTKNNHDGLLATYESLLMQTSVSFEWIIVDSVSTDATCKLVENKIKRTIKNFSYIREPDEGIFDGMNKGISAASNNFIIFMNAGDMFATKDVIDNLNKFIKFNTDADLIYGNSYELNDKNELLLKRAKARPNVKYGMIAHHQAMCFKKETLGMYNLNYKLAADYERVCFLLSSSKKVIYIDLVICIFERGGVSQTNIKKLMLEYQEILKNNFELGKIHTTFLVIRKVLLHVLRIKLTNLYDFLLFQK